MDKPEKKSVDLLGILKSWIPWNPESTYVSKDFWMPDHACRVCYECDSQFTVFNRRHHCRICGRIFCAKCTTNSVPVGNEASSSVRSEGPKVRVCNYCFKQWEQGLAHVGKGPHDDFGPSPSAASMESPKSSGAAYGSIGSMSFSLSEQISESFSISPYQSAVMDPSGDILEVEGSESSNISIPYYEDPSIIQFELDTNRSDDDDDDDYEDDVFYSCELDFKGRNCSLAGDCCDPVESDNAYTSYNFVPDVDNADTKSMASTAFHDSYEVQNGGEPQQVEKKEDHDTGDECASSLYAAEDVNIEPVDFENNGLLWLPPEPENEDDDREAGFYDDDADGGNTGEWGHLRSSGSFGSGQGRGRERSVEEQKAAMKNIVDGHFRALVSQLLQVEDIPVSNDNVLDSWLEIITALSWEAATLLKPDTSRGGGMDPGGYVKVKCIASGRRSESMVVAGVVCKKNVAHRRMRTRIDKPRIMILGGALEYQRVSNVLSSFDTLLQQEMDHLKMAVAKIDAHRPNVLLVEKSVSRYAQEYILAKDISLVLNIKRPLLERMARCTGAQIVPSIDHLSAQKMGYCDLFHVDRCFENHGSAGQSGKKLTKTLMYFEGCPKPLGCTILLRGANGNELKKLKHVVQYGVFAAYHLALETSFLADEGASLPELQFNETITVALPNKSSIERSISMVSGFTVPFDEKQQNSPEPQVLNAVTTATTPTQLAKSLSLPADTVISNTRRSLSCSNTSGLTDKTLDDNFISKTCPDGVSSVCATDKGKQVGESMGQEATANSSCEPSLCNQPKHDCGTPQARKPKPISVEICKANNMILSTELAASGHMSWQQGSQSIQDESGSSKEEFPPTPSDHQSILVSLSSRSVWKGTICERSHLLRIKYYGNFDKPLGRFLQDHLFDQSYKCRSCGEPSEAHVHCYTHRQGTLTISVKKLEEILLPGEQEGKIWMWHRCLRCPRTSGFPPATRRVFMSDAAWGLSFGKFLELSFSNHAAASRVASCGHSLHRDCLRFYGSGKMVACFRYAPIDVYSVYLPPATVEFNHEIQDWIQNEADEVVDRAEVLFSEVHGAISKIVENKCGAARKNGVGSTESKNKIIELERALRNEKMEFEEMCRKTFSKEVKKGQPSIDILETNRLRRQLLFQSYMWDHRLVHAASLDYNSSRGHIAGSMSDNDLKTLATSDSMGPNIATKSSHAMVCGKSLDVDPSLCRSSGLEKNPMKPQEMAHQIKATDCCKEDQGATCPCGKMFERSNALESGLAIRRALSDSQFLNLTDTLDAAWTGKTQPSSGISKENSLPLMGSVSADSSFAAVAEMLAEKKQVEERAAAKIQPSTSPSPSANSKSSDSAEDMISWFGVPFLNFYHSLNKNFLGNDEKLDSLGGYSPMYVSSVRELALQGGAKWLLPVGSNETVIPVYDDEPTSIISYALMSQDYHSQLSDEGERLNGTMESFSLSLQESASFHPFLSLDESMIESLRGRSIDETLLSAAGSRNSTKDPLVQTKSLDIRISFTDNSPLDKVKYTVTCYYAKHFDALRKICCPSELDFIRSLSRCKKWGAQGGKSNVFFAKTLDDRFIIKQVTKTELESFIKFAPEYFKYLTESISSKSPTCLAKILGIYQVATKHLRGGKESKMDVLVMENLLFRRNVARLYDLKGSSRSRYNPDSSGNNKVLLDQNLIEAMPTSPIFVGNKAKRLLERAVWNDTSFLASVNVMDYSLLVGVDEEHHELVLGIIDFMRQYTWDKHLETWVKASGILGGPKNVSPTVISPKQYKKRFRKAMTTYFLMVPDQWSPSTILQSKSQTSLCEENAQGGYSIK